MAVIDGDWSNALQQAVKADLLASESWDELIRAKCNPEQMTMLLGLSCEFPDSPGWKALDWMRSNLRQQAQEKLQISRQLRETHDLLVRSYGDHPSEPVKAARDALRSIAADEEEHAKQLKRFGSAQRSARREQLSALLQSESLPDPAGRVRQRDHRPGILP